MVRGNRGNHILELKETPFSIGEGRFLMSRRASPCIEETPPLFTISSIHSPLHSERGRGRGCRGAGGEAASLISRVCSLLFNRTVQRNEPYILTMSNS